MSTKITPKLNPIVEKEFNGFIDNLTTLLNSNDVAFEPDNPIFASFRYPLQQMLQNLSDEIDKLKG